MIRYMPASIWSLSDRIIWLRQRLQKLLVRRKDDVFLKMRVGFIICGAQKGGTSALAAYLNDHPEICMAKRKEVHFFDVEINFRGGQPDYSVYHAAFNPKSSHKITGEATPNYMYWRRAPKRICDYNPGMKLIVVLRNPIDRAYSHWNMERSRRVEYLSFSEAVKQEEERCRKALPYQHKRYSYVDRGFYLRQLEEIWKYFPRERVLILKNEWLMKQPNETLQKVFNFLGVVPFEIVASKNVHSRSYTSSMTYEEKKHLRSVYEDEIRNLENALGWDCSDWLTD